jgi:hypothetical protein
MATADGRFTIWVTDSLERIEVDVDGIAFGSLAGPRLWALRTDDGSVVRIDPWNFSIVALPSCRHHRVAARRSMKPTCVSPGWGPTR